MDRLYLVHARARSIWGGSMNNIPSRFLSEIPAHLVERRVIGGRGAATRGGWGADRQSGEGGRRRREWDAEGFGDTPGSGRRITGLEGDELDEKVVGQYFAAGERVLHALLGEGTVLAVEGGGIVLVRFENDGSERRLMASVAPLRKLRA
jgi:DNA helicase-2/ATP-dependent DNA helicase PcrA